MKELLEKLQKVQSELHVGKTQYNDFGKYMYRNQEDILEAVKPLLLKHGLFLWLSDELCLIGERYYTKATVHISDGKDTIEITAFAREDLTKKGMDGSQVSGASSSYARKYALAGAFLLDEAKDADALNKNTDYGAPTTAKSKKDILKEIAAEANKEGITNQNLALIVTKIFNVSSSASLTLDQVQKLQANFREYWKEIQAETES